MTCISEVIGISPMALFFLSHIIFMRIPNYIADSREAEMNQSYLSLYHTEKVKVKEESKKVGLKLNIQKPKIVSFSPITSLQIDGETVETLIDFHFWGSKITADGDCSHEIKRCFLLGRKALTNIDSILKAETFLYQQRSV